MKLSKLQKSIVHLCIFRSSKPLNYLRENFIVRGLARHDSLVAQWLDHPTSLRKAIGSIPVGDSDFFSLSHARLTATCSSDKNLRSTH